MFDVSAENLWLEIKAAERFRDNHLTQVQNMIDYYAGSAYRGDGSIDWSENHMFEYIRLNTSKVVFDNPKVRIRSRRPASQGQVAVALQHGLNRNIRDTNLRRLLKRVFVSQCFSWDCVQTVIEPQNWMDPRTGETYQWPQSYQIENKRFFFDPLCRWFGGARYAGHKYVRDKEDILSEAREFPDKGWIVGNINEIAADSGVDELGRKSGVQQDLRRKELVLYEIWVPEVELDDPDKGFNGALYTIAVAPNEKGEGNTAYVREPRPFYGPRWGPYTLYGVYPVPNDPWPLSPFVAVRAQMEQLNNIVSAANRSIESYKKIIICSADNPDLYKKLKNTPDMFVVPVRGFQKDQVVEVELGGITKQHVEQIQLALDRMDRNSGIDEAHRGNVGSRSTATEIAVADEAAKGAISYVQQEFQDATIQMLETRCWYMYHDDRVSFPLGEAAIMDLQMGEPWFEGGRVGSEREFAYDDIELSIEAFSMERMSEALQRAQYKEQLDLAIQAAGVIPNTPFYDWKMIFDRGGDVNNDPSWGDFFNPEIARLAAGAEDSPEVETPSEIIEPSTPPPAVSGQFEPQRVGGRVRQAI